MTPQTLFSGAADEVIGFDSKVSEMWTVMIEMMVLLRRITIFFVVSVGMSST